MKPLFISVLILTALFTAGMMNSQTFEEISASIDETLKQSRSAAQNGAWEEADEALRRANRLWSEHDTYLHIMLNHNEIDEAESLFAEARTYVEQKDTNKYCTGAQRLSVQIDHIKESQQLKLKNVF